MNKTLFVWHSLLFYNLWLKHFSVSMHFFLQLDFKLFVVKRLREECLSYIKCSKWVTAILIYDRLINEKNYLMNFFSVPVQTSDTCNFYNTFEKATRTGNWVASEWDCKQLLPHLCAKMVLNHWWFLKVEQGRWGWLTESYAWYTNGVPTIPILICKKNYL